MSDTLLGQRNKTYLGFVADGGRETKGVLWAPLSSIILMSPSHVRRIWPCDSWGHVSFGASFPYLWPNVEGLVFPGTAGGLCGAGPLAFPAHSVDATPGRVLRGLRRCSERLASWSAVGLPDRPGIDWIGDSGKPQ